MHKLIIFLALIACALASLPQGTEHQKHPHQKSHAHPHQAVAHNGARVGHAGHTGRVARASHGRDLRVSPHGQKEAVHHGPVVSGHNKQFQRVKKSHKTPEGNKRQNTLRRVHKSDKHHRH